MKTMRFFLMIAAVSFATMIFASKHPAKKEFSVTISLEKALECKALSSEMVKHLNPGILSEEKPGSYYATIRFRNITYVIYGKYQEWASFFNITKFRQAKPILGNRAFSPN